MHGKVPSSLDRLDGILSSVGMQTINNTTQDEANTIQYDVKAFLSSDIDVRAGDVFVIDGIRYESAKEPFVYVGHQEVLLVRKGYAYIILEWGFFYFNTKFDNLFDQN